ncbi:MAG: radical SAM protein [Nitrospira sp.]|nr:radical SAM protein [bacterium]MBL7049118.1 radical SAM protein [Nitrospira sp.]
MKVLLINPLTIEDSMVNITPNLGLGYLATALRDNDYEVEIWDGVKLGMTRQKLIERLNRADYDVAGFQVYTRSVRNCEEVLQMVKSIKPDTITLAGGPHPSGDPEGTMKHLLVDYAFRGEAEIGLVQLLDKISGRADMPYEEINNLIWKDNDGKVTSNPLKPIEDLNVVAMPSWDLIDPREYPYAPIGAFSKKNPLTSISTTRGCPYSCTFCANRTIMGRKVRARNAEIVLQEMELLHDKYGIREFQIIDDNFTSRKALSLGVCEGILAKGWDIALSFPNGVRLSTLDEEILSLLEKAGCYSLGLGIESGSLNTLKNMKKAQSLDEIREKVELIHRVTKIRTTGFFIIGYPTETKEDIMQTIKFSQELPIDRAQFTICLPVPGSEMTEQMIKSGKLADIDFSDISFQNILHVPEGMTMDELKKYRLKAYTGFYLRLRIILGLFSEIQNMEHVKFLYRRVAKLFSK